MKKKNDLVSPLVRSPPIKPLSNMNFKGFVCLVVIYIAQAKGEMFKISSINNNFILFLIEERQTLGSLRFSFFLSLNIGVWLSMKGKQCVRFINSVIYCLRVCLKLIILAELFEAFYVPPFDVSFWGCSGNRRLRLRKISVMS